MESQEGFVPLESLKGFAPPVEYQGGIRSSQERFVPVEFLVLLHKSCSFIPLEDYLPVVLFHRKIPTKSNFGRLLLF